MSFMSEQIFKKEVLDASVPVIVHFWAPWCGLCRLIEPCLHGFQSDSQGRIKLVSINADENLKLTSNFQIKTLPTVLFFQSGQLLHRLDTFKRRDDLRLTLEHLLDGAFTANSSLMAGK